MTGHEFSPPPATSDSAGGGNGNGHNLHGRVSAIEAHLQHLATRNDISNLKVWILVGVLSSIPVTVAIVTIIVKVFF